MQKYLSLFLGALALTACDNDLDIKGERRDLSIVYAVLDPSADSNFVRVQRGYLGDAAASASFDEGDSLYYEPNEVQVLIREIEPNTQTLRKEEALIFDTSRELQEGIFSGEGFHLWRLPEDLLLNRNFDYEVVVVRSDGSEARGRTPLVGSLRVKRPLVNFSPKVFDGLILFEPLQERERMTFFQLALTLRYSEYNVQEGTTEQKSVRVKLPVVETQGQQADLRLSYDSDAMATALAALLPKDTTKSGSSVRPSTFIRFFEDLDLEIIGGSESLQTYIELSRPSGGVNQNRPAFPQISNGTGIVTSGTRAKVEGLVLEASRYRPNLSVSSISCDLNFATIERNGQDTCWCVNNERRCY